MIQLEMFPKHELADPLEGLDPESKKECEWCGKIRRVKDLVVLWSTDYTCFIACREHIK